MLIRKRHLWIHTRLFNELLALIPIGKKVHENSFLWSPLMDRISHQIHGRQSLQISQPNVNVWIFQRYGLNSRSWSWPAHGWDFILTWRTKRNDGDLLPDVLYSSAAIVCINLPRRYTWQLTSLFHWLGYSKNSSISSVWRRARVKIKWNVFIDLENQAWHWLQWC